VLDIDSWVIWSVVIKFAGLLAMAGVIGGSFIHLLADRLRFPARSHVRFYVLACAVLGWLVVPLHFLLQVGGINHSGIAGMFDPGMSVILLQSALGQVLLLRLLGFVVAANAVWLLMPENAGTMRRLAGYLLSGLSALLLSGSFAVTGHTVNLAIAASMLLVLHVLAVSLWIGALYPLLHLSGTAELVKVHKLMRGFGALALCIVAALLLAGVYLATQLLQTPADLLTTSYGNTLLLKLTGVAVLLALAALNKLLLTPRLAANGVAGLQRSIRCEIALALYVVAVTSWMTTATGPAGQ